MKTAINGTELFYEIDGEGPTCFVLHGGLGLDHSLYRSTLQPLTDSLQLIFLDHRGNGRSGRPPLETITMEQLADDVAALADHLHIDKFLVFGHSYGGFIAQEVALRHPARVTALLLISTGADAFRDGEEQKYPVPTQPDQLLELRKLPQTDLESATAFWIASIPHFTNPDTVDQLETLYRTTIFDGPTRMRGSKAWDEWHIMERLPSLTMPVLLVVGSRDVIKSPNESRRIADQLSNGTLVEIHDANHFPFIETPEQFFDAVLNWLHAASLMRD